MSISRRVAKTAAWPIRRLLDPRFGDIARRLLDTRQAVHDEGTATRVAVGSLTHNVDHVVGTYAATSTESLTFVGSQMRDVERSIDKLGEETASLADRLGAETARLADAVDGKAYTVRLNRLARDGKLADLDGAAAELLNFASGHRGFAAQAELWLNSPLTLSHEEGRVELGQVNERIAEVPFAFRALGAVPFGARVLDFGSSENSLALSLASMGYEVTALDLREYPFEHPRLRSVASRLEDWDAASGSFDAVMCVSTVEHVGLGWYGEDPGEEGADRRAMDRLKDLLVPGGLCVLTVPYGTWSIDALQRRYDREHLDSLVDGWDVMEQLIIEQRDDQTWMPVDETDRLSAAMLVLRSPAEA